MMGTVLGQSTACSGTALCSSGFVDGLRFSTRICSPRCGTSFQVHEKTALLRGREYEEGQVVALRSIFVKYIGTI